MRFAAERACGLACEMKPAYKPTASADNRCGGDHSLRQFRGGHHCTLEDGGVMSMACVSTDTHECGARLSSSHKLGRGTYSVTMKTAVGPGVLSAFYLTTIGEDHAHHDHDEHWNEIDFEVLGTGVHPQGSQIWTNFYTAPFRKNRDPQEKEHGAYIKVPFDLSNGFHTYTIDVTYTHIKWMIDSKVHRSVDISQYKDLISTISSDSFQAQLSVWGQNETSRTDWEQVGFLENNKNLPTACKFKDMKLERHSP